MIPIRYDVTAIGLPFADTVAEITDDFLKRFGLEKESCGEYPPAVLSAIRNALPNPKTIAGGSPPNTCVVINQLGGRSVFMGRIADDKAGKIFHNSFAESGVIFPNWPYRSNIRTSSGAVILMITPDKATTIAASPGIGRNFGTTDILPAYIQQSKILFIQGEFLENPITRPAADLAIQIAKKAGRKVAISLHGQIFTQERAAMFQRDHLPKADIVNGNRAEFDSLFGGLFTPYGLEGSPQLLVVTNDKSGADIVGWDKRIHIPAYPPRKIVDTIGAGDAYAGTFIFGYVRGLDLQSCGEFAAEVASAILEIKGGRPDTSLTHIARKYLEIGMDMFTTPVATRLTL